MSSHQIQRYDPEPLRAEIVPASEADYVQIREVAATVAKSRMFPGMENPDSVFVLMMLCQSDGIHYMQALRRYHVVKGRPAMRADAMQAEFQRRGGRVKFLVRDAKECEADFTHPSFQPEPLRIKWTIEDARRAGLLKEDSGWIKYPRAMLHARVVSEGVRSVDPGVVVGIYTEEEIQDFDAENRGTFDQLPMPSASPAPPKAIVKAPPRKETVRLASQVGDVDLRPYHEIVKAETDACLARASEAGFALELKGPQVHQHMLKWAAAEGIAAKPEGPLKLPIVVETMQAVYSGESRDRVREEIAAYCASKLADAEDAAKPVEAPTETREPGDEG